MADKKESDSDKPKPEGKNWLEWTIFGMSSVLVLTTLGFLLWQTLTTQSRPALLEATLGEPVKNRAGIRVPVTVRNRGDETAENVDVEVTAPGDETGSFTLAFVPRGAERHGWVVFEKPFRRNQLDAQIKGYEQP